MLGSILRKLRGRSVGELRERGGQALAAWRERAGRDADVAAGLDAPAALDRRLAPGAPRSPAALLDAFRARGADRFFPAFDDPSATVAALRARCPDDERATIARADRVLAGRFDLLGYRGLSFGDPIDWHLDPVAGRRAPLEHWSRVPYLDAARVGDHKVVWELNRQQWLVTLGQAYWYTGDERYADGFARAVGAWADANPPKLGINWASSLEVAFRAISWVWALQLFRWSPALTPALHARLLSLLHLHARHLERHLSTYFSPNTHLTGEALGLFVIGSLAPELAGAPRWRARGARILREQLAHQVRPDGTYFEQATQYHRYTVEFYLHLDVLLARSGEADPVVHEALDRLCTFLLHVAGPDGRIPLIGDDDGGRFVQLDGGTPEDVRAVLATAAAVLGRPDLAWAGRGQVAPLIWLLGPAGLARLDETTPAPPAESARLFADGGFAAWRDGWGEDATHAVIDGGPHGVMNCGHAHTDALSLVLTFRGRPVLVDAGTFSYPGEERNAFRGAAAHNVVTVDGVGSSEPAAGAFQWTHVADAECAGWTVADGCALFEGGHGGFARLADPVEHARAVLLVDGLGAVVRDRLRGRAGAPHLVTARWHAAPGLDGRADEGGAELAAGGEVVCRIAPFGQEGELSILEGWVSPQYGARQPAPVVEYRQRGDGAHDVLTAIVDGGATVTELPAAGAARALRIEPGWAGGDAWVVVCGDGAATQIAAVETDARWAWVRLDPQGAPRGGGRIGGTYLRAGGAPVASARRAAGGAAGDGAGEAGRTASTRGVAAGESGRAVN